MRWDDVNARAAGLVTHLLDRGMLLSLAEAGSWSAAARLALDRGFPAAVESLATIGAFDRAVGLVAAERIALLDRWLGPRAPVAAILTGIQDRVNLRILLRGVVQGAAPAARLRGTIPSRELSARALEHLAAAPSLADLLRRLRQLGHPAARALTAASEGPPSGLFGLELALARVAAARAARQARRGGRAVRGVVAATIDLDNAWSLLAVSHWGPDATPDRIFIAGGRRLPYPAFERLSHLGDESAILGGLAAAFDGGPFHSIFRDPPAGPAGLEAAAARARQVWYRAMSRQDPLGPGRCFAAIERIRAEAHDLRLVLGALATGLGRDAVEPLLASVG